MAAKKNDEPVYPTISVIVTAYNRKKYVINALTSLKRQSIPPQQIEIILIKNFEDDTVDSFCKNNGILVNNLEETIGNYLYEGIRKSRGEIISFLDDDDEWEIDKTSRILEAFRSNPKVCYIHNSYSTINEVGEIIRYNRLVDSFLCYNTSFVVVNSLFTFRNRDIKKLLISRSDFNLSCISIKKEYVTEDILMLLKEISSGQDAFFFFTALFKCGELCVMAEKLTRYRIHTMNVSRGIDFSLKGSEVGRELNTLFLLRRFFEDSTNKKVEIRALNMMITEYKLLKLIFSESGTRSQIFWTSLSLLRIPHNLSNPLRLRVMLFGSLALIHNSFWKKIYKIVSKTE